MHLSVQSSGYWFREMNNLENNQWPKAKVPVKIFCLISLVSHQKSYLVCDELSKFGIFIYFQAAVSTLFAVSVLYVEDKYYIIFKISYFEIRYFVKLANRRMRNQDMRFFKGRFDKRLLFTLVLLCIKLNFVFASFYNK